MLGSNPQKIFDFGRMPGINVSAYAVIASQIKNLLLGDPQAETFGRYIISTLVTYFVVSASAFYLETNYKMTRITFKCENQILEVMSIILVLKAYWTLRDGQLVTLLISIRERFTRILYILIRLDADGFSVLLGTIARSEVFISGCCKRFL